MSSEGNITVIESFSADDTHALGVTLGQQVLVVRMNKNKKFQKEQLMKEGYEEFVEFFNR